MDYLKALIQKDEQKKINELKKIIVLGKKLNKDVTPDVKKLEILEGRVANNSSISRKDSSNTKTNTSSNNDLFYSIKSVYTLENKIIVDFNVDISEKDIKFFELNQNPTYKDVYDIKGYFKDAAPTKLDIDGINKIVIGQFKPDVLRIVLSDKRNLKTSYTLNKKQLIITTDALIKEKNVTKKSVTEKKDKNKDFIDLKNSIRSIHTEGNKIIFKFNKNYSKNDVQFVRYKNASFHENVFNIKGKYKYTNPTKLSIDGVYKIIVSENKDEVKLRILNDYKQKVSYSLNKRELVITSYPKNSQVQKAITAQKRVIDKVIVIDPGHGGNDVGAVGANKIYEKVINLNVSKNLYNILKRKGYKVYLTRHNDKFIKVMQRTVLANKKNADIFISIHTNAIGKAKANKVSGIETFFLSPARSERAKRVAALENKSDIREMSNSSKDVFLESLNRPRITASHKLAIDVQAGLLQSTRSKYKNINDSGVREGPFWVLVGAQMPSILVELGYVTHPVEGKRLYNKQYQKLLAEGIANGIDSYFSKNP